ncbi:MAG: hypothetical protein FJ214_09240 [Ignavibacteria bacterium]|nr:hypothetical protein [Ignavibacteria bacterium]
MKVVKIFCVVVLIIASSEKLYSQFEVEFNETKGTLSQSDKYKQDFGRYDGYQIPLYKGEAVNFVVYSEKFSPRIVFVSPKGNIYKQSIPENQNIASIVTTVPEEGEWILYIVGDKEAYGEYTFQYAFASSNSLTLPKESDFCKTLNFIIAHAKAYFLLFENPYDSQQPFVKLNGAKDAFIEESDGSYSALFLETDNKSEAEQNFKQISDQVSKCLGTNWKSKTENYLQIDDYKVKTVTYYENVKEKERFIKVLLLDLKDSKQKFLHDFVLQILVNKNQ